MLQAILARQASYGLHPVTRVPPPGPGLRPVPVLATVTTVVTRVPPTVPQVKRSKVAHPRGVLTNLLVQRPAPGAPAETTNAFFLQTMANARTLVWNSVQASTRDAYAVPWKHWVNWTAQFGTDRFLATKPAFWTAAAAEFSFGFTVAAVIAFVTYLFGDLHLKPSTVMSYVSGVKFML